MGERIICGFVLFAVDFIPALFQSRLIEDIQSRMNEIKNKPEMKPQIKPQIYYYYLSSLELMAPFSLQFGLKSINWIECLQSELIESNNNKLNWLN